MKQIKFTDGCPNQCSYCYEPKEMKYHHPLIPLNEDIQIQDMNFLSNPDHFSILRNLPKNKSYEFTCGIDFRRLDQGICDLMKQKGFVKSDGLGIMVSVSKRYIKKYGSCLLKQVINQKNSLFLY